MRRFPEKIPLTDKESKPQRNANDLLRKEKLMERKLERRHNTTVHHAIAMPERLA